MRSRTRIGLWRIVAAVLLATGVQAGATATATAAAACASDNWNPWRVEADRELNEYGYTYEFRRSSNNELEWRDTTQSTFHGVGTDHVPMWGSPSAIRNRDGRVVVFITTDWYGSGHGAIYYKFETFPGSRDWSGWVSLGGVGNSNPEATQNHDGRIEVFVRGTDNLIYHRWQDLNYNWVPANGWASFGGAFADSLVRSESGRNRSDGKIVIKARSDNCYENSKWQYTPGGDWYPPTWWYQGGFVG
ncbi:hypothetical protein GCM10009555_033160 [Acrocarpospora macrocephala]|uniref:PLL-like beta propeller domain-containing protein n=1 Tax=Acrocarpospora macrocephala TaxID=150177 RepID=A0A5M3WBT0_9ACTN|nr:hypothetical protein [Acrocarpospora macrocephala]GES06497.1 hypothetical protein Amac_000920 [Acrocarpospora macrocephala]